MRELLETLIAKMAAMSEENRMAVYRELFTRYCQYCGSTDGYDCVCTRDD